MEEVGTIVKTWDDHIAYVIENISKDSSRIAYVADLSSNPNNSLFVIMNKLMLNEGFINIKNIKLNKKEKEVVKFLKEKFKVEIRKRKLDKLI